MKTNILTDFLLKCVPPDAAHMFNDALDLIVYFRMGEGYDQLVSALSLQSDPYPFGFKDTILSLMNECLMDIAHDHGLIVADQHFPILVKLIKSMQHLIQSPDTDCIEHALIAWEDAPKTCYQLVLEGHGGCSDIDFHEVVLMVAVSAIEKLQVLHDETKAKVESEIANAIDAETIHDPEKDKKRMLLRQMNGQVPKPELVLSHITGRFLDIGHPVDELMGELQPDFEVLMPKSPETAAVNLLALTVLGTGLIADITKDAKKLTERFYKNTGDIAMINEQIDILTLG